MECVTLVRPQTLLTHIHSIIAVHGLGGDAFNTWADGGNIWLRDFLPGQIPNARIMSYGYNSAVAFSKSVAGIDEYPTDLLNRLHHERETAEVSMICNGEAVEPADWK